MSKLIELRQRIKTIETVKKITHAMRLISMASHTQIQQKKTALTVYARAIQTMIDTVETTGIHPASMELSETVSHKKLTIIIGAQKGLCAVFNTQLYIAVQRAFEQDTTPTDLIIVGKKMIDALEKEDISSTIATYPHLTQNTIYSIAQDIATHIRTAAYRTVHVWSNQQKNFFIQLPHKTVVLPISSDTQNIPTPTTEEYWWPENPRIILDQLWILYIATQLQSLLLESLAAEQAARFIAMHSATHNAQQLIDSMRLDYNKLRQAKITSELADLSASF